MAARDGGGGPEGTAEVAERRRQHEPPRQEPGQGASRKRQASLGSGRRWPDFLTEKGVRLHRSLVFQEATAGAADGAPPVPPSRPPTGRAGRRPCRGGSAEIEAELAPPQAHAVAAAAEAGGRAVQAQPVVNVPTLKFRVVKGSLVAGRTIGSLCVNAEYGIEIVKMRKVRPGVWIDFPSARDSIDVGDLLFVIIDRDDVLVRGRDANTALMAHFSSFFRLVGNLDDNKDVVLVNNGGWSVKFSLFVNHFCLESEEALLQCERFSMFELPYLGAHGAILGPKKQFWAGRPFPPVPPGCLALHMTRNFDTCPKLLCRKGDVPHYIVPLKQWTHIRNGDLLLVLLMGAPGSHKFELDHRDWAKPFHAFLSESTFESHSWTGPTNPDGIGLADPEGIGIGKLTAGICSQGKEAWADICDSENESFPP